MRGGSQPQPGTHMPPHPRSAPPAPAQGRRGLCPDGASPLWLVRQSMARGHEHLGGLGHGRQEAQAPGRGLDAAPGAEGSS